jgi:subtilisin family serine protease
MRSLLPLLLLPGLAAAAPIGPPTGDLIVRFDAEPTAARLAELATLHGVDRWEHRLGSFPVYSAVLEGGEDPLRQAPALAAEAGVRWAEADRPITPVPDDAPLDDPLWDELWHLENVGQSGDAMPGADIKARGAWAITDGTGVIIAVHDSGVDLTHPDLRFAGTGIDIIDDDYVASWEAIDDGAPHGTAVSGVAAAIGGNALGTVGVAYGASVLPVRILGTAPVGHPVTYADMYDAFAFSVDSGAAVINNSWGLISEDCTPIGEIPTFSTAMEYAITAGRGGLGTTVVWSSGNQGCDGLVSPWHDDPGVIAVGATNDRDERIGYSTQGPQLDVVAPSGGRGGEFVTTTDISGEPGYSPGDYSGSFSGTSCSAPVVSGVLALMYAANPRLRWDQAEEALCATAERVMPQEAGYDVRGWSRAYGCGRVDAAAAVAAVANASPEAPVLEQPIGPALREDQAVLVWSDVHDADGDALTWRVEVTDDVGEVTRFDVVDGRRWDGRGLLAPGRWTVRVAAVDLYGEGAWTELRELLVLPAPTNPERAAPQEPAASCSFVPRRAAGLLLLPLILLGRRRR